MEQEKRKILIIDDNLKIQEILSKFFREEGYTILNFYTGRGSCDLIKKEKPDLIVMDMVLPGEDSLEILGKFQNDPEINVIPRIVLSNLDDKEQIEKAKEKGVQKYLFKPHYKLREILKEIEDVFSENEQEPITEKQKLVIMLNDDEFLLSVFKNIFEKKAFEFKGFDSIPPSNVAKMFENLEPLVIIVDLVMCFDGIKVIQELKASESFREVPLIVLDNVYNEEEVREAKEKGADLFISMKDNNPNQAMEKILNFLSEHN
jgi:CheY-like chemotaxis protein